jgi:excisionase family DNA binding protein
MEDRLLLRVDEAAKTLGIGRTLTYRLILSGELGSVKVAKARRVPRAALESYVRQLTEANS